MDPEAVGVPAAPPTSAPASGPAAERGHSLTARASLTAVASLLDYAARLGVGFIVTPILVSGLGRSLFGVWEMLGQLVGGYMSASDGRPTEALRLMISSHQATEDAAARRRWVGGALVVWFLFLPVIAALGAAVVWLAPTMTKVGPDLVHTVRITAAVLIFAYLLRTLAAVPESVLRGMNLGYKRMGLQAGLDIVGGLLTGAAVTAGLGLAGAGGAQVILGLLTGLCFWVLVRQFVPGFGIARPSRPEVRTLLRVSAWLTAAQALTQFLLASDVVVLGLVMSPAVVATYVLTNYAARTALGVLAFTVGSAMPGFGGLLGQHQYDRAATIRGEIMTLTWLFATAVGASILLWNRSFLALWVGPDHYAGFWVNLLLVCILVQTSFIRGDAFIIDAALRPRLRVVVMAVAAVIVVGASVTLARAFGMVGLCIGILLGRATQSVAYPLIVGSSLQQSRRLPLGSLVRPLVVMLAVFAPAAYAGEHIRAGGWLEWVLLVLLTFGVTLVLALMAGVPALTRRALMQRARSLREVLRG
jgi:O-antigen/teichoic acid export membrane protein